MECPCPISIKDPRAKKGAVRIIVPCTKCPICLQNKRVEWSVRLQEELRIAKTAYFITLTYDDTKIPINEHGLQTLVKKHVQDFNKRLRKAMEKHPKMKLRFYAVGEYGSKTERPHYHGIYFNIPVPIMQKLADVWKYGFVHTGTCTPAAIHYTCKYIIQKQDYDKDYIQPPFSIMSLKPALGSSYIKRNDAWHVKNKAMYMVVNGKMVRMPRYYKDQIFTESEKAEIGKICMEEGDKKLKIAEYQAKVGNYNYDEQQIGS